MVKVGVGCSIPLNKRVAGWDSVYCDGLSSFCRQVFIRRGPNNWRRDASIFGDGRQWSVFFSLKHSSSLMWPGCSLHLIITDTIDVMVERKSLLIPWLTHVPYGISSFQRLEGQHSSHDHLLCILYSAFTWPFTFPLQCNNQIRTLPRFSK